MIGGFRTEFDPELDLLLERTVPIAPQLMWQAWTQAEHLKRWFVPRPWSVAHCQLNPVPGGIFHTIMRDPEGNEVPSDPGCFLHLVENELIVFTDALLPGFRPAPEPFFTAVITFRAQDRGTHYTARAIHGSRSDRDKHDAAGFGVGWGTSLDQLVELMGR